MERGKWGPNLGDFNTAMYYQAEVGVRYRFTSESHGNLRFDYAWGKSSHEAYFFIGEAFRLFVRLISHAAGYPFSSGTDSGWVSVVLFQADIH